ncbi:Acetyltransferase (GNAT) domain-containing protein [Thermomonospora echinospora]|uniref:Acetyltransferase (GNAT) domain-containing protein n=1 Tax=Thermomonospora echinospora TaxID=1992 RepID=A0A1H6D1Z0_9ACTN|nr:GNAT family N-acetyltransferase [Thermomonospora echinospora]SEG79008.1 Acetyltransferase (GNAT) domain-containing protein [Thermomonospora echinospora]
MTDQVTFRRLDAAEARRHRDLVADIHRDAYADSIATGDAFASDEAFMTRFDAYTGRGGFDLVFAYADDTTVGQTWGWALAPDTAWWSGLVSEPESGFTVEDGTRTFALSELMVRRAWTGQGIAHALHDALLSARTEQRATLLVRPDNATAYNAYTRWGWRRVSQLRPGWPGAPLMDVLVLELPLESAE